MDFVYRQLFIKPSVPTTSFAGQTVIVTGSNVGLGKEAARHIAQLGASKLILAVRNTQAGEEAKREIEQTTQCASSVIEVWKLDLSNYDSVKAFAKRANELPRIDVLLENAGVSSRVYQTSEGRERTIVVNVISTFLLALLMLPKLKASAKEFNTKPRLVVVSSEVHAWSQFPEWKEESVFSALDDEKTARMGERYPTSKLLEVLAIRQIAPKLEGSNVILNYLNPGFCHSELAREPNLVMNVAIGVMKFFLARTTEMGSRTLVASAAAGQESHGKYMSDGVVKEELLSPFVQSDDGAQASIKVWTELSGILEKIQPGVTSNL